MRAIILTALILVSVAVAQDTPVQSKPTVSPEFKDKFKKYQSQVEKTQKELQLDPKYIAAKEAEQGFADVITEFQVLCGKDFQPRLNEKGDPECVAKPKTEK